MTNVIDKFYDKEFMVMERYEYEIVEITDESDGRVNWKRMKEKLNQLGAEGWHLVSSFSNELGSNTSIVVSEGRKLGKNSTIEQNILIFERKLCSTGENEDV